VTDEAIALLAPGIGTSASFPPGECGPANMATASLASSKAKVLRSAQQPAFVGVSCPENV
jgi:hypothetical protein